MKRRQIKISLFVLISIVILYYVLTILVVRNGQFVNYDFPSQFSIENSVYNKNFIREVKPDAIDIIDTLIYEKTKDKFEIYLCETFYYKSYGMFGLFRHRVDFENSISLNVNFLGEERFLIKYDDDRFMGIRSSDSFWNIYKIGSNVKVEIFTESEKKIVVMNFLNLNK